MPDAALPPSLDQLALQAYIYGFPLVFNVDQVLRYVSTGVGANPAAPWNSFSHARSLATPADRFVTINNDTVYSMAQLDVSAGPLVLQVPDTAGRYYVLQFVSAWTDNFAYIGSRATGTGAGAFLLVGPEWVGDTPDGMTLVRFPTPTASIVGRWAVASADDLVAVHALQDAVSLVPWSAEAPAATGMPVVAATGDEALDFFERYRVWSQLAPVAARDLPLHQSFEALGLTGDVPVSSLPADVQEALRTGYTTGRDTITEALRGGHTPEMNGWLLTLHVFDYNLDNFAVGTLDEPRWRIEHPIERLVMRAGAALGGLWGNHAYEAAYLAIYVDEHGEQLVGRRRYELVLDPPPPNDAFWSLTMYDVPDYFLVDNPIDRYSVGDRTPGLVTGPTGAVTIVLSADRPDGAGETVNWLPAPAGAFRPMLRVYLPGESVLDGTYVLPPIRRVD